MEQIDAGDGTLEEEVDAIAARLESVSVEGVAGSPALRLGEADDASASSVNIEENIIVDNNEAAPMGEDQLVGPSMLAFSSLSESQAEERGLLLAFRSLSESQAEERDRQRSSGQLAVVPELAEAGGETSSFVSANGSSGSPRNIDALGSPRHINDVRDVSGDAPDPLRVPLPDSAP